MNAFAHWFDAAELERERLKKLNPFYTNSRAYKNRERQIETADTYIGRHIGSLIVKSVDGFEVNRSDGQTVTIFLCDCACGRKDVRVPCTEFSRGESTDCGGPAHKRRRKKSEKV